GLRQKRASRRITTAKVKIFSKHPPEWPVAIAIDEGPALARPAAIQLLKKNIHHGVSRGCASGKRADSKSTEHGTQYVLMLIDECGFESLFHLRPDDYRGHVSSAACFVTAGGFIKDNHQDAVVLKGRARNQGCNVALQPCISSGKLLRVRASALASRAIMSVMVHIGNHKREFR